MDLTTYLEIAVAAVIAGALLLLVARLLYALSIRSNLLLGLFRVPGVVLLSAGLLGCCLSLMSAPGLFVWMILMGLWGRAAIHARAARRRNLFGALTLAAERGLPLSPMAIAVAADETGRFARRTRALANRLRWGSSLKDVAPQSREVLPNDALLATHVGEETGDLRGALRAATYGVHFDRSVLQPVIARFIYVFIVSLYVIGLVSFLMIKVGPAYRKIFDDFDSPMPMAFTFSTFAFETLAILAVPLVAGMVGVMIYTWLQWRGTLVPRLPGLRKVINWVDMAPVLRLLGLAARRDQPLDEIVHAIAIYHPKRSVRARAWRVMWDIDEGQDWARSLTRQRLLEPADAALLAAAQRSGNLKWALDEMADGFERRATFRAQALAQLILPLVMLPLGLLVTIVAVGYFTPIAKLISDLS